ncbi:MAG: pilus assembly protein PilN [Methylococcaceae bacterium]|nr:pilus assembly protein PilN [Methylococcaceae bacterium]
MVKINLLPWREELRQQQQRDFLTAIGLGAVLMLSLMGAVHMHVEGLKSYQAARNQLLQTEIDTVDKKITEIKEIEDKKNKLLVKIDLIQNLQESRPQIVHLFDEIAKRTPDGVFLTQFKQTGKELVMDGKAQSNARVSAFMREVENSGWLSTPRLTVIKGQDKSQQDPKQEGAGQLSDFTLLAAQSAPDSKAGTEAKP